MNDELLLFVFVRLNIKFVPCFSAYVPGCLIDNENPYPKMFVILGSFDFLTYLNAPFSSSIGFSLLITSLEKHCSGSWDRWFYKFDRMFELIIC